MSAESRWPSTTTISVPLLRRARLHRLVPNQRVADGGPGARLLLHTEGTILRSSRPWGTEQGAVVPGRLRHGHSNVAGHQASRGGHRWPRRRFPPAVRTSGQHDLVLHRQAQEVIPHVQELRHCEHLEFQMDLRRDQCLRSIENNSIFGYNRYHASNHVRQSRSSSRPPPERTFEKKISIVARARACPPRRARSGSLEIFFFARNTRLCPRDEEPLLFHRRARVGRFPVITPMSIARTCECTWTFCLSADEIVGTRRLTSTASETHETIHYSNGSFNSRRARFLLRLADQFDKPSNNETTNSFNS